VGETETGAQIVTRQHGRNYHRSVLTA